MSAYLKGILVWSVGPLKLSVRIPFYGYHLLWRSIIGPKGKYGGPTNPEICICPSPHRKIPLTCPLVIKPGRILKGDQKFTMTPKLPHLRSWWHCLHVSSSVLRITYLWSTHILIKVTLHLRLTKQLSWHSGKTFGLHTQTHTPTHPHTQKRHAGGVPEIFSVTKISLHAF